MAVLLLAAGAGAYVLLSGGDVSNPDVEFRAEPTETPAPEPAKTDEDDFTWPVYGRTPTRRHYLPASKSLRPPFRRRWSWSANSLLEFTPVLAEGKLFIIKNNAAVYALNKRNGKVRWRRNLGKLAASAPAYADGRIYVTILVRDGSKNGLVAALRAKDGARLWTKPLPSRTESSPLVANGRVYFGSEDGTVYALRANDGSVAWRYKATGAVKGAPALADGKLYFGDYGGRVHAIRERDGKRVWSSSTSGARFGTSSGQFYASPAVAFGRVYIGNTDSNVYSFSASSGKLAWRTRDRRLRLRVGRGRPGAGRQADRLRRLLRRALLRARRPVGEGALEAQGAGPHLGRRDRGRRHRLLRRPQVAHHHRAGRAHGPQGAPLRPRRLQPRDRRRAQPLRGRLHVALAAQAAIGRTLTPASARWRLSSATEYCP